MNLEIKKIKKEKIKPYKNNARKNEETVKYLEKSIKEFGFLQPILISDEMEIVCGHSRFQAGCRLGMEEFPCLFASDLTDEQIREFRIIENRTSELADWDYKKLEIELGKFEELHIGDFGFEVVENNIEFNDDEWDFDFDFEDDNSVFLEPKQKYRNLRLDFTEEEAEIYDYFVEEKNENAEDEGQFIFKYLVKWRKGEKDEDERM